MELESILVRSLYFYCEFDFDPFVRVGEVDPRDEASLRRVTGASLCERRGRVNSRGLMNTTGWRGLCVISTERANEK